MKNILIVDDSQTVLFDTRKKIRDAGLNTRVLAASNFEDALSILESNQIDLAFVDLQMPDKNGADLIVLMKSKDRFKNIPIVVLTSTGDDSLLKTSLAGMVNYYISKPISQQQVKDFLQEFTNE